MKPNPRDSLPVAASKGSSLARLQPVDASPFKRHSSTWFIWSTIFLVWLVSLLPWRLWQPAPDLLLLVIAFWSLNEPRRVSMFTAFMFGLFMDVHDGALLGEQALTYTLVSYAAVVLGRRLLRFGAAIQAIHMLPVFVLSEAVSRFCHAWLASEWAGWGWVWAAIFTAALWPLADVLLHMPQRGLDDNDAGAV